MKLEIVYIYKEFEQLIKTFEQLSVLGEFIKEKKTIYSIKYNRGKNQKKQSLNLRK